ESACCKRGNRRGAVAELPALPRARRGGRGRPAVPDRAAADRADHASLPGPHRLLRRLRPLGPTGAPPAADVGRGRRGGVQLGPNALALGTLLNKEFGLSWGKVKTLFARTFGLDVAASTLCRAAGRAAAKLEPTY